MPSPILAASGVVANWGQCGGMNGAATGDRCGSGYECVWGNKWYWQCKPCSGSCCPANSFVNKKGKCKGRNNSAGSSAPSPPPPPAPPPPPPTPTGPPPTYGSTICTTARNVKASYWAQQSDAGGCEMPKANYAITDAIAVGDIAELMDLKIKQNPNNRICGQVLRTTNYVCTRAGD